VEAHLGRARELEKTLERHLLDEGLLDQTKLKELRSPERACRLGRPEARK
jgi:hypothetical protein